MSWARRLHGASCLLPAGFTFALAGSGGHLPGIHCPFYAITGTPCPTCYLSRATAAALQGKLAEAAQLHLFSLPAAGLLLIWSALALQQRRLPPLAVPAPVLVVVGLALFLYWILRLAAHLPLGLSGFPIALPP
ncbi:MAG: DUF2752 domain-containing protein [Cyanobacteriota bacterium]|nr:DUF2752 domain-containing protein [Cyanobacteriota bacterium]